MDILQYLIELLKTRKQIGIEGLGTLYKKKTPGRYDAETHSFLPPSYTLEFTADVLEHTNLVQYIQNKRGISEDSAKYFISQFVSEINNGLQQGEYTLENLGVLNKVNDQLSFKPNQNINTGFDFFALPAVTAELPKIEKPVQEKEETHEQQKDVTEEPQIEQVQVPEFAQEIGRVNQTETEEEKHNEEVVEENVVEDEVSEETEIEKQPETAEEEVFEEITEVNTAHTNEETKEDPLDHTLENNQEESQLEATEEDEATEEEVFEEISEINVETTSVEHQPEQQKEHNDTWDFDGENVVSEEDVQEPEKTDEETKETVESEHTPGKTTEDFTLTSTTHDWNFDSVRNEKIKEEPVLVNEFDQNEIANDTEDERKMPFYQKLLIGLAILLTGLAIAYVAKPELFEDFTRNTTNPDQKIAVPIERSNLKTQQDSLDFADSIMETAEKVGLDVKPAKDTLKVTTTKTEAKPAITYDIIAAAFAKQSEVDEYIAYMKSRGFDAKIANMPGKIYKKISIASYNNIDSAEKNVVKFRKQLKNTKIYVQKIKNN